MNRLERPFAALDYLYAELGTQIFTQQFQKAEMNGGNSLQT